MPETIHLLIDTGNPEAEDLKLGLEDLLLNTGNLVFEMREVSTAALQLSGSRLPPGKKGTLSPYEIELIEESYSYSLEEPMFKLPQFGLRPGPPPHRPHLGWVVLYEAISEFRLQWDIPATETAILLTPHANEKNWFSGFRSQPAPDGFVQTTDWEYYQKAPFWFPVAQQIWAMILQLRGFGSLREALNHVHMEPVSCLNDFCEEKIDFHIKLRTADICPACQEVMLQGGLSRSVLYAGIQALEKIRRQTRFIQTNPWNEGDFRVRIDAKGVLHFPNLENMSCPFAPIEKALYLFFVKHPEGVALRELSDHLPELLDLYRRIRNQEEDVARPVVQKLADPLDNSAYEKISRINKKLELVLLWGARYEQCCITNEGGRCFIPLAAQGFELDSFWI